MTEKHVLIVDDEPDIRELLGITFSRMGLNPATAGNLGEARAELAAHTFDFCVVDMRLPDGDGIDLVREISARFPRLPVAMITAHGNMETAIAALKAGAFDFLSKPVDLNNLRELARQALKLSRPATAPPTAPGAQPTAELLGESQAVRAIRETLRKVARSQAPVHITGESGTGKELAARLIHAHSARADQPFVPVNCGAISPELMESELFGHLKGSFTGAVADKPGLFHAAHEGTLFLDEIAELPLPMQVKLLRAIQEKRVRRVGGAKEEPVDARIISATNEDLAQRVADGLFRQDLFYRIHVIEIQMPALREHPEDLDILVPHIASAICQRQGITTTPQISRDAMQALAQYPFPGNVRELENILERALALCEGDTIRPAHLRLPSAQPDDSESLLSAQLDDRLAKREREFILKALEDTRWNRTAAARKLGITLRALRYRLEKLGINQ